MFLVRTKGMVELVVVEFIDLVSFSLSYPPLAYYTLPRSLTAFTLLFPLNPSLVLSSFLSPTIDLPTISLVLTVFLFLIFVKVLLKSLRVF
jgi:hypothetical protein